MASAAGTATATATAAGSDAGSNGGLMAVFKGGTVADFPFRGEVVEIETPAKVIDAFKALLMNGIGAVPVYDTSKSKYAGFVSVADLAKFVVDAGRLETTADKTPAQVAELVRSDMSASVLDVVNLSNNAPFLAVQESDPIVKVVQTLSSSVGGASVHRVPVLNKAGRVVKIVSQGAVIQYMKAHTAADNTALQATIGDLKIGSYKVLTITTKQTALEAFRLIVNKKVSSIGILDADDADDDEEPSMNLIGQISSRDILALASAGTFFHAALPALEFVSKVRELSDVKHKGQSRPNVITVRSTFTLKQVIGRLAATKVHRVYVVDGEGKPAAVVSLKDLLRHFVASSASAAASS